MPVEFDGNIQTDGSLAVTRLSVPDTSTSNLSASAGPIAVVLSSSPVFGSIAREGSGILYAGDAPGADAAASFNDANFEISREISNISQLPFAAKFDSSSLAAGQNIWVTSHATANQPAPTYIPASTVTLLPQTIDGTVTAVAVNGAFKAYTVSLAAYSLFPQLANQALQTTVLTNPQTVTVYADNSVQALNTNPIGPGSVLRFRGVIFNDGGALRMDCMTISDGIAM